MRKRWIWVFGVVILAWNLCIFRVAGFAHGTEEHHEEGKTSKHMQAMMAVKDNIPAEYQVMERTPIIPDKDSLDRGRQLYRQKCAVCHGEGGRGDGPVAKAMAPPPANFLDLDHSAIYGPGEKYWIIGNGSGETGMPAFNQIAIKDRWDLVNFILQLQKN